MYSNSMTTEPRNAFANKTMRSRLPDMLVKTAESNKGIWPQARISKVLQLAESICRNDVVPQPVSVGDSTDATWEKGFQENGGVGKRWQESHWYFAEQYMFRLLLIATGYFDSSSQLFGHDPFKAQKHDELMKPATWHSTTAALRQSLGAEPLRLRFKALLQFCLWGNRADLNYAEVADSVHQPKRHKHSSGSGLSLSSEANNLLLDDSEQVWQALGAGAEVEPGGALHFICDNSGLELLLDLVLADLLLTKRREGGRGGGLGVGCVVLNVKQHPTYVSDTCLRDVTDTLRFIEAGGAVKGSSGGPLLREWCERLRGFMRRGVLVVAPHPFWNTCNYLTAAGFKAGQAADLAQALSASTLTLVKGDCNYRRLLRDVIHKPATASFAAATASFPAKAFCCLRTCKSDPICGLPEGVEAALDTQDAQWRVNGRRGVIQAVLRPGGQKPAMQ